jgi:hypothetical protein
MDHGVRQTVTRHAPPPRDVSGNVVAIQTARSAAADRHAEIEKQAAAWVEKRFPTGDPCDSKLLEDLRIAELASGRASKSASSPLVTRACICLGFAIALAGPLLGVRIGTFAAGLILMPIALLAEVALRQQIALNRVQLELLKLQALERASNRQR